LFCTLFFCWGGFLSSTTLSVEEFRRRSPVSPNPDIGVAFPPFPYQPTCASLALDHSGIRWQDGLPPLFFFLLLDSIAPLFFQRERFLDVWHGMLAAPAAHSSTRSVNPFPDCISPPFPTRSHLLPVPLLTLMGLLASLFPLFFLLVAYSTVLSSSLGFANRPSLPA